MKSNRHRTTSGDGESPDPTNPELAGDSGPVAAENFEDVEAGVPREDPGAPVIEVAVDEASLDEQPPLGGDESSLGLGDVCEAILFASQKPVSSKELRHLLKSAAEAGTGVPFGRIKESEIHEALSALALALQERAATYEIRETAAGWQLVTRPDFAPWLRQLFPENRPSRLSAPALETLAIIAYRQPITRADIEAVRGVSVDGVMQTLLDRGLVRIGGRAEVPGRPLLYETTQFFMEHFGLRDLDELPNAGELRKIALPTAAPPQPQNPVADGPVQEELFAEQAQPEPGQVPEGGEPASAEGTSAHFVESDAG